MEALKRRLAEASARLKERLAGRSLASRALLGLLRVLSWLLALPFRLAARFARWLRRRWVNRKYRRMRDLPISASFVIYALVAFAAGALISLVVIRQCEDTRAELRAKYAVKSVTYSVPPGGRYAVRNRGNRATFTLYDADDLQLEQFTVNFRREQLIYEVDPEQIGGVYHGAFRFTVMPRYTADDQFTNIFAITVSVLVVPVACGGALILCAMLFFRRKLKRPIAMLTQGSARIARNDLDFAVRYDSRNELGQLCDSFETMRGALVENNREMWRHMEERKRLNAAFSHDLRTPLTVLKGHASMLLSGLPEGAVSQEELMGEIAAMSNSIARMERYVDAMTRLQRLEDAEVRREPVPFDRLAAALQDTAEILCTQAGRTLSFEAWPSESPTVSADLEVVQQVAENILANGARYARESLHVRLWVAGDRLLLRVKDDGPGFSPVDLRNATEPFYKARGATNDSHLGLGLNICKILCRRHGGDIRLENDGGGSVTASFGLRPATGGSSWNTASR